MQHQQKQTEGTTTGPGSDHVARLVSDAPPCEYHAASLRRPRDSHATLPFAHDHSALSIKSDLMCNCQSTAHHGRPAHSTPLPQVRPRAVGARRSKVPQGTQLQRRRVPRRRLQRLPQRFRQSTSHCIRLSPLKKLVSHHS